MRGLDQIQRSSRSAFRLPPAHSAPIREAGSDMRARMLRQRWDASQSSCTHSKLMLQPWTWRLKHRTGGTMRYKSTKSPRRSLFPGAYYSYGFMFLQSLLALPLFWLMTNWRARRLLRQHTSRSYIYCHYCTMILRNQCCKINNAIIALPQIPNVAVLAYKVVGVIKLDTIGYCQMSFTTRAASSGWWQTEGP